MACGRLIELVEIKGELLIVLGDPVRDDLPVGIEQQRLGDGVDDALRVFGKGHVDAGGALDLPHLAQQHIEHDAVDGIVGAVEQARLHLGAICPKRSTRPSRCSSRLGFQGRS